ncbi:serine hydrolase domain-containing protein [Pedococcus sp. P5_B7]
MPIGSADNTTTTIGRSPLLPGAYIDPALLAQARMEMALDAVPGVGIGVYHQGRVATAGLGVSSVLDPHPVTGETMFQIASITKTFTATALLQLVEQGLLSLDDPIRKHLPAFAVVDASVSAAVTIRDCLTHSCGWEGDLYEDPGWGDDALATIVGRMKQLRQVTPLGELWSYNNAAFYVLGRVLEVVQKRPFEAIMKDNLLRPLGMNDACFFAHEMVYHPFVVGHAQYGGRTVLARPWEMPRCGGPIGGLIASPEHMMRYADFQLAGGEALGDETRLAAFEPSGPPGDRPEVGLGWWLDDSSGERVVSHGGGANGQPCLFAMIPSRQFALAIFTNGELGSRTADRLLKWAMRTYFGLVPPEMMREAPADVSDALGVYESRLERQTLRQEGDRLLLDRQYRPWLAEMYPPPGVDWGVEVDAIGADKLLIAPGHRAQQVGTILRAGDQARWLRIGRRAALREGS